MVSTKFEIANLELYCPDRHGYIESYDKSIYNKYLILYSYDVNYFYDNINEIYNDIQFYIHEYSRLTLQHPIIKNYLDIIKKPKYLELKIIQPIKVYFGNGIDDYYSTGIDKTIWIKIIQRKWRNIFKKRVQLKKKIESLRYRQIYGKWPLECNIPLKLGL